MSESGPTKPRSLNPLLEGVREGLAEGAKSTARWAFFGAVIGALALGGFGLVRFGSIGLVIGGVVGLVLGGLGAVWFYWSATSLT